MKDHEELKKCLLVIEKSTMTTELILQEEESDAEGEEESEESQEANFVFYKPNLILKFEDIIDELYNNPDRGKSLNCPVRGYGNYTFSYISKADLLSKPPQNGIVQFNNSNYRMDFFGIVNEAVKTKMLEHMQDSTMKWIGPYKWSNYYAIFSANDRSKREYYGFVVSFYKNHIYYSILANGICQHSKKFK